MNIKWETVLSVIVGSAIFMILWELFLQDAVAGLTGGSYDRGV